MLKQKNVQDTLLNDKSKAQSNIHKMIHLYKNKYEHIMYKKKRVCMAKVKDTK